MELTPISDVKLSQQDKIKEAMIKALEQSLGIVTHACRKVGISTPVHYKWLKEDKEYKHRCNNINEYTLDHVEGKLFELINDKTPSAVIFYLKTKGKHRGYSQSATLDITNNDGSLNNRILSTNPLTDSQDIEDAEIIDNE